MKWERMFYCDPELEVKPVQIRFLSSSGIRIAEINNEQKCSGRHYSCSAAPGFLTMEYIISSRAHGMGKWGQNLWHNNFTLSIERRCEKHLAAIVQKGKATEEKSSWKDSSLGHVLTISLFIFLEVCRIAIF